MSQLENDNPSILEDFEKKNIILPTWYKGVALFRILWVIILLYGFLFSYFRLNISIFKNEIVPIFLTLFPSILYYLIQCKKEFFLSISVNKLILFKVYSLLTNFGLLYFAYHENSFQFMIQSQFFIAFIIVLVFYIMLFILSLFDVKYLLELLWIYNKESL